MKKTICLVAYAVLTSLLDIVIFNGVAGKGLAAVIGGCSIICAVSPLLSGKAGLKVVNKDGKRQFGFLSLLMSNLSVAICILKIFSALKSTTVDIIAIVMAVALAYVLNYLLDKKFSTEEKYEDFSCNPSRLWQDEDNEKIHRW